MAFIRLLVILAIPLAVIYLCLLSYLCAQRRAQLEQDYQPGASDLAREAFVRAGVRAYAERVRSRLALAVFGLPLGMLATYIYLTN